MLLGEHWPVMMDRLRDVAPELISALEIRWGSDPSLARVELDEYLDPPADNATILKVASYFAS